LPFRQPKNSAIPNIMSMPFWEDDNEFIFAEYFFGSWF
jgi:hypothetical protein